jgi:phosphoribosyl 1,2-cyclic phosphodiesterase
MQVTFYGVRGTIPAPGPSTVRYGGNTSCVLVRLASQELLILDCGTGARNLGLALKSGPFGAGAGRGAILLSHPHWDHIQGFPFFAPFYVPGNVFSVYGSSAMPASLEEILEGQMAPQYFPVQSFRNMGANLEMREVPIGRPFAVGAAQVEACENPHGGTSVLAFRIEEAGRSVVYASDAGYGPEGPSAAALTLYRHADLLIHDATYTPEDRRARPHRGLASVDEAALAAVRAGARRLALFHYDQDYADVDVDALVARGRQRLDELGGRDIEVFGAAEGLSISI